LLYITTPDNDKIYTAVQGYLKEVGIDVELDQAQVSRFDQVVMRGGKWEGIAVGSQSPNPDIVTAMRDYYTASNGVYGQMVVPDDYLKAIKNAIGAVDFKVRQKSAQEAIKLMIDKYCLMTPIHSWSIPSTSQKYVHNHGLFGFNGNPNIGQWMPEEAWMDKK
jgi:peptide/nickel transport system substrate-binding protein